MSQSYPGASSASCSRSSNADEVISDEQASLADSRYRPGIAGNSQRPN